MLIQIHILQNYAPSNLNRDDTGSPKDAMFGGYRRGRISSQCLKRSIRKSSTFAEAFEQDHLLGARTKRLPGLIRDELEALSADAGDIEAIVAQVPTIGRKGGSEQAGEGNGSSKTKDEAVLETRQLIFIGWNEVRPLAEKLLALYQEHGPKKWEKLDIDKELGESLPRSVDIAMFGRMTTADTFEDVQASVQVAHALSTNALAQEFDYYTAVDDLSGELGAGMIGDIEFNSSTYYKYLNIHWEQLVDNLGSDVEVARRAVLALLRAAATAQPSGKQNSFAAYSLPDLVLVEVSETNLPVSYTNAFIKPVRPGDGKSLMDASVEKLVSYIERVSKTYDLDGQRAFTAVEEYAVPEAEAQTSLAALQSWLTGQLPED